MKCVSAFLCLVCTFALARANAIVVTTVTVAIPTTVVTIVTQLSPVQPAAICEIVKCKKVVTCPPGTKFIRENGEVKKCTLVRYGPNLASTTCDPSFCCTPKKEEVVVATTCKAASVQCGSGQTPAVDNKGQSVPCLITYNGKKLIATTCDKKTCCVRAPKTVTVTTWVPTTTYVPITVPAVPTVCSGCMVPVPTSSFVPCNTLVKCRVYNTDPKTKGLMRCKPRMSSSQACTSQYCCCP